MFPYYSFIIFHLVLVTPRTRACDRGLVTGGAGVGGAH